MEISIELGEYVKLLVSGSSLGCCSLLLLLMANNVSATLASSVTIGGCEGQVAC